MIYQVFMNGTRLGCYPTAKRLLRDDGSESMANVARGVCAGAVTGGMGAVVGSPFFMVKCRLQGCEAAGVCCCTPCRALRRRTCARCMARRCPRRALTSRGPPLRLCRADYSAVNCKRHRGLPAPLQGHDGRLNPGTPARLRTARAVPAFGSMQTLIWRVDLLAQVFKAEGVVGLFRGVDGAVPRVMVGSVLAGRFCLARAVLKACPSAPPAPSSPARPLFLANRSACFWACVAHA